MTDTKTSLQFLFLTCKVYWNDDNVTTSPCNISAVFRAPYSFTSSTNNTNSRTGREPSFRTNILTINADVS
jgi:hypothetical protein